MHPRHYPALLQLLYIADEESWEKGELHYWQSVMTNWFSQLKSGQWTRNNRLAVSLSKWGHFLFSFTDQRKRVIRSPQGKRERERKGGSNWCKGTQGDCSVPGHSFFKTTVWTSPPSHAAYPSSEQSPVQTDLERALTLVHLGLHIINQRWPPVQFSPHF